VGPAAAVGAATVWVVVVAVASGQQQEQVLDVEATGLVGYTGNGVSAVSACMRMSVMAQIQTLTHQ